MDRIINGNSMDLKPTQAIAGYNHTLFLNLLKDGIFLEMEKKRRDHQTKYFRTIFGYVNKLAGLKLIMVNCPEIDLKKNGYRKLQGCHLKGIAKVMFLCDGYNNSFSNISVSNLSLSP